MTNSLQVKKNN